MMCSNPDRDAPSRGRAGVVALLRLWTVVLVLACATTARGAEPPSAASIEQDAAALEKRLLAPCCWRESLHSHDSPLAEALRLEIRTRLARGEPAAAIDADLLARYGTKVRLHPSDRDLTILWLAASGVLLVLLILWARRRLRPVGAVAAVSAQDECFETMLDDELARSDG